MPSGTSQNDGYTCLPSEQRAAYNTVHNNTYLPHGRSVPFSWGGTRLAALSVEWPLPVQQAQLPRLTHATVCLRISAASRTGIRGRAGHADPLGRRALAKQRDRTHVMLCDQSWLGSWPLARSRPALRPPDPSAMFCVPPRRCYNMLPRPFPFRPSLAQLLHERSGAVVSVLGP